MSIPCPYFLTICVATPLRRVFFVLDQFRVISELNQSILDCIGDHLGIAASSPWCEWRSPPHWLRGRVHWRIASRTTLPQVPRYRLLSRKVSLQFIPWSCSPRSRSTSPAFPVCELHSQNQPTSHSWTRRGVCSPIWCRGGWCSCGACNR